MENNTEEQPQVRNNPLLEKVQIPGEKFRLPSGGLFYTAGELHEYVKDGEVFVNPMTAMNELTLKSPDKLLSGEAVIEVFGKCIPEISNPSELLAKDVDYLLMCLRMVSYGPNIDLKVTHDCENAKEHLYSIPIRPILQTTKQIDPTAIKNFKVTISNGQVVLLHPPKFLATVALYQLFGSDDFDTETVGEKLLDNIASMIISVDNHKQRDDITEWLKTIRVGDVQLIGEKVGEISDWGIDPIQSTKCKDCKKVLEVSVPVNPIAFFT